VALIDATSSNVPPAELAEVAAALQIQVDRDLRPVWNVRADVAVGTRGRRRSRDVWPMWLVDPAPALDFGGIHLSPGGVPTAVVVANQRWTFAASHELIEMLVDPFGNRFAWGPSLDAAAGGRMVRYLVEPADPCEGFPYEIDGIIVTDFATPAYFGLGPEGEPYDHLGRLNGTYALPPSGNLSWWDLVEGRWYQKLPPDGRLVRGRSVRPTLSARVDRDLALTRHGGPDWARVGDEWRRRQRTAV
jgi:hypothetical protein